MQADKIKENMRQRDIAGYVYEFIRDTIEAEQFSDPARFASILIELIQERHCRTPESNPQLMTHEQVREFEKRHMPFGHYVGTPVKDVPLERLQWYADQDFTDDLRRYLKSHLIQREIELERRYKANTNHES